MLTHVGISTWYGLLYDDPKRAVQFLAWTRHLAELIQPVYGWAGTSDGILDATPISPERVAALEPQPIDWVNVFGPPYVERLGIDRLLRTPAWRVEVLAVGSIGVTLAPYPGAVRREDAERVIAHLGLPPLPGI